MPFVLAADLLAPNLGLLFWTGLAFGILLFLLSKYAWGPITKALTEREQTIESSLTRAEAALARASQMQADNESARREAERQAQTILRDARETADRIQAEQVDKTKAQLAGLQETARADIEREKQQALAALRAEVAGLAIGAAEKILGETMDDDRQRRLVDRFIADLPTN